MIRSLDEVSDLLREVALRLVLPSFREQHEFEEKSPGELVTAVDHAVEAELAWRLASILPGSRVVGEEAAHRAPHLLDHLDSGWTWIVDPLDGTRNFVAGSENFGMMVALLRAGETVASWILAPALGRLAVAERGSGATVDGVGVRASERSDDAPRVGMIYTRFLPPHVRVASGYDQRAPTGAASIDYLSLVEGRLSFVLYWRTLVWDHAPGALLVAEAGGKVARLDGTPYRPADASVGLLATRHRRDWSEVRTGIAC